MKRIISLIAVTLITFTTATAQRISVVTESGATSIYRTLQEAIEGADSGSTIYLPGGGFTLPDSVKITKRLTIIGIGHKSNNDNADGFTNISGNLYFNKGSDASAVLGCYVTGTIYIGNDGKEVDNVLIRYCNIYNINVHGPSCMGTVVNQCYLRATSYFNNANGYFTNNIAYGLYRLNNGFIENNIFTSSNLFGSSSGGYCDSSSIKGNIILSKPSSWYVNNSCHVLGNMMKSDWSKDEDAVVISAEWSDVFTNYNGGAISSVSDFHFMEDYKQYESKVGIYAGGTDFDKQLAPVPYIVSKSIPQETDAAGNLNIKIRVKAGD